jgi:hypothetical protein
MLKNNPTIKSLIDKLWNNFWRGGINIPHTAIEQIKKVQKEGQLLLFLQLKNPFVVKQIF